LEHGVRASDVLICATLSREPLVRGEWLREGQHITAVGADDPSKCELDASVLQKACVFVDLLDTTTANGDVHRAGFPSICYSDPILCNVDRGVYFLLNSSTKGSFMDALHKV
jgi:hypothetical protein